MFEGWSKRDAGLFLLALLWLAFTIGVRPLALPDEGRYVGASWEMLTSGNWLYPMLDGMPFFHKPPLFYWITAASLDLFGRHEWAARVAPLIGAVAGALTLYGFVLRQKGEDLAHWTLLVLVTQMFFFGGAQFANLDMLVAGFIDATVILAAEAMLNALSGKPYKGLLVWAYLCAALGTLAKGLIGFVLPGMILVVWLAWNRKLAQVGKLISLPGLLVFAVVGVPWFAAMQVKFPDFLNYFFVYNHFQRFAEHGFNNPMPVWFYLPVIFVLGLPWTIWLFSAMKFRPVDAETKPTIRSLMWIWPAVIVGFFSIPSSKIVGYILPVLPPLAYVIAEVLRSKWGALPGVRPLKGFALFGAVLCVGAVVANNVLNTKTAKGLSSQIAAQRQPGEPVIFLRDQYFDVPFYLGLKAPVKIIDDWNDPNIGKKDNSRKALFDAGKFAPDTAKQLLLLPDQLLQAVCSQPVSWLIGPKAEDREFRFLKHGAVIARHENLAVWRVAQGELAARGDCQQTPSGGSAGK